MLILLKHRPFDSQICSGYHLSLARCISSWAYEGTNSRFSRRAGWLDLFKRSRGIELLLAKFLNPPFSRLNFNGRLKEQEFSLHLFQKSGGEMPATPTMKWQLTSRTGLRWHDAGEESLVFNPASGDTHLLDLVSSSGLACLEAGPLSGEEICQRMALHLELPPEKDLRPYVSQLLSRLRELGLVESVST